MGGSAFGPDLPARRITTASYLQVEDILKNRLSAYFGRMEHLRFFDDKETHGDLDLLCTWIGPAWAFVPLHKTSTVDDAARAAAEAIRDEFAEEVAKVAGAVRWRTSGGRLGSLEIHLGIPCSILPETPIRGTVPLDTDDFYQVDLLLCPPSDFDFRMFTGSYSTTNILFCQAVRGLAYELTLREEDFILRHAAIDEVPRIDVVLTADITEFCTWLGIDYARWQKGFANRKEFWEWAVDVTPGSNMAYSARGLARKHQAGYVPPLGSRPRVAEMTDYYAFLQTTQWASLPDRETTRPARLIRASSPAGSQTEEVISTPRSDQPYPLGVEVKDITDPSVLYAEIDKPSRWPLKPQALRALNYWGTRTEYFNMIAERRETKKLILRNRLKKVKRTMWTARVRGWLGRVKMGLVAGPVAVMGMLYAILRARKMIA